MKRESFNSRQDFPFVRRRSPLEEWAYGDQPRPYTRLPRNHPDYDAEDCTNPIRRFAAEAIGGLVLAGFVLVVAVAAQPLGPLLPRFLDWLSGLL
jgi:hypothetical protein